MLSVIVLSMLFACSRHAPESNEMLPTSLWQAYVRRFVTSEGRVVDTGQGGISTSEGQGYGMLLAVAANDRMHFEQIWHWARRHLGMRADGLLAWAWHPALANMEEQSTVPDTNNATDGDLLVAWALSRAGKRWHHVRYTTQARHIAMRIRTSLVKKTGIGPVLLPGEQGFIHQQTVTINPSYWVLPALRAMYVLDPDPVWAQLRNTGRRLLEQARYGPAGLPADWLDINHSRVRLSAYKPARFGFDAIRVPLYWIWDGAAANTPALLGVTAFVDRPHASAWIDLVSGKEAGYAPTSGEQAVAALVRSCLARAPRSLPPRLDHLRKSDDYYSASLILLAHLAWEAHCTS